MIQGFLLYAKIWATFSSVAREVSAIILQGLFETLEIILSKVFLLALGILGQKPKEKLPKSKVLYE